jgi:hypothetical protein
VPAGRRDSETDLPVTPDSLMEVRPCGRVASEALLLGEGELGGAFRSASPIAEELMLASREDVACAFADCSGRPDSRPLARAAAAVTARWPVLGEVESCFDGPVGRRICREAGELRDGGAGVVSGRCSSPAAPGVEAGVPCASEFDASVAADEAAADGTPNAAAVDSLIAAAALGATAAEALIAGVGDSDPAIIDGLGAASAALGVTAAEALIAGVGDSDPAIIDGLGAAVADSGVGAVTRGFPGVLPAHIACFTSSTACRASSVARAITAAKSASRL